jgi:lipopolysaccharide/colanic/teichoic acid biosynthesis glycosyltransferase
MDKKEREMWMNKMLSLDRRKSRTKVQLKVIAWEGTVLFAKIMKVVIDYTLTPIMIILAMPIFILTTVAIYIDNPGPIIFRANRVGKDGKQFSFLKFRSMRVNADQMKDALLSQNESKDGVIFKIKRDPRITRVGRMIRRTSIDELPQLFNVIKGDMSLVGPRPPLPREVALYTLEERKRLHVKPGITGRWQVSGRSETPFQQQVQYDLEYINSKGIWKDVKILLQTIPAVIGGKGAY